MLKQSTLLRFAKIAKSCIDCRNCSSILLKSSKAVEDPMRSPLVLGLGLSLLFILLVTLFSALFFLLMPPEVSPEEQPPMWVSFQEARQMGLLERPNQTQKARPAGVPPLKTFCLNEECEREFSEASTLPTKRHSSRENQRAAMSPIYLEEQLFALGRKALSERVQEASQRDTYF